MTTYSTGNPVGSSDPRDLYDNAENLDNFVNGDQAAYDDRLGKSRKSWQGMEDEFAAFIASSGYEFVGDYAAGIELTGYQQILRDTSGEFWRLSGSVTLPYTTTGAGLPEGGNFVSVGDAALRQELNANTVGHGSDLVAHTGTSDTVTEALNKRTIYVGSVSELEGLDVPVGAAVQTLGYYTPGDGGANDYEIVAGATGTADGGSFIDLNNGLQARGLFPDEFNVRQFGAGDSSNDNARFQAAADFATYQDYQTEKSPVLKSGTAGIDVPSGSYVLTSKIVTRGQPVWNISSGAIIDASFLTGVVSRESRHVNSIHTGILENATTLALRAGRELNEVSGVYGIASEDAISRVGPPHSVTLQLLNDTEIVPIELTGTTYTLSSVTYTNSPDLSGVKTGATITVLGSPTHTGIIDSINEGTKTITLTTSWRPFTGVDGATGTPTNGDPARVDYFGKIWAQNSNVELKSGNPTQRAAGYELGCLNQQADATGSGLPEFGGPVDDRILWGYDAVNLGSNKGSCAFLARSGSTAQWLNGFISYGNNYGFRVLPRSGQTITAGFVYDADEGNALVSRNSSGANIVRISHDGNIEIGDLSVATIKTIDFHSSGVANDYDARIAASGGSGTNGGGTIRFGSASCGFDGVPRPTVDNTTSLGQAVSRWTTVYATTGTINTSDERFKSEFVSLDEKEKQAALECKKLIGKFKWLSSVEEKGYAARWHFGVGAQSVAEVFAKHGLNANNYGLFCYDEWDEQPEVKDKDGEIIQEYRPAGNRYGIRYEELLAFIISAM